MPSGATRVSSKSDPMRYRIRFLILTILAISPAHGYDIAKKIQEVTSETIKPSPGSIYPVLHELEREGLVEEETLIVKGRVRKIYKLTRKGMEQIAKQLDLFTEIINRILGIITEARKSIQERLGESPGETCVPQRLLEGLKKMIESLEAYIKTIRETGRICSD